MSDIVSTVSSADRLGFLAAAVSQSIRRYFSESRSSSAAAGVAVPPIDQPDVEVPPPPPIGESGAPAPAVPSVPREEKVLPPVVVAEHIQSRLFRLLGDARLDSGVDFDTDAVLHKLFVNPQEVEELCRLLAQPFLDGDKKIAAVIGLGGYGSTLAYGVARLLPPYPFGKSETRSVSFLSIDKSGANKGGQWRLASEKDAGTVLRAKKALIVAPVLTRATCADIQVCVKLIEEGLGVNATIDGVSALYQLQCSDGLPKGRIKVFDVRSVVRLDFRAHSHRSS